MPLTPRSLRRAAGLALVAALGIAGPVAAQGRTPEETKAIDAYRLTMPVLRKVLPALYAPGASSCERRKDRDPHTLGIAEMTHSLERCAPVMEALGRAGVRPREAALVFASMLRTGQQVAMRSGNARALPPGALRDNALLLEQNDPELRRLTNPGAQS